MILETSRFGTITVEEEQILQFPFGIPGFQEYNRFAVLKQEDTPFAFLQSIDNGDLAFVITNPFDFYPDYAIELTADVQSDLAIHDEADVLIYSIVTVGGLLKDATINLLGPIVVNVRTRQAKQIVLQNSSYGTKHKLFALQEQPSGNQEASQC